MNEKVLSIIDADYRERMRQFYELFPTLQNAPQAVAQIVSTPWGAIWRFLKIQNRH